MVVQGHRVTTDAIRAWLNQFGSSHENRLMFQLLAGIKFYSQDEIRAKLKEGMGIVKRRITERRIPGQKSRRDILLTSFGGLGKSGTKYARLFASENRIIADNIFDITKLMKRLESGVADVQCVVVVDDIIGSGESAATEVRKLAIEAESSPQLKEISWFYIVICGFVEAVKLLERSIAECGLPIEVSVCDSLTATDRAFAEDSTLFMTSSDRIHAHDLCYRLGQGLEKEHPLGYNDTQALIKSKSTASGGETPKGSAVPGVYRPHRDRWHTEGTLLSRSSWSRGDLVSTVGLGEDAIHRCIP